MFAGAVALIAGAADTLLAASAIVAAGVLASPGWQQTIAGITPDHDVTPTGKV